MNTMNMMISDEMMETVNGGVVIGEVLTKEQREKYGTKVPESVRRSMLVVFYNKNENLEDVARMFGTTVKAIMLVNEQFDPTRTWQTLYMPCYYKL